VDLFGNPGAAGSSPSISFDTLAPTLTITTSSSLLSAGQSATVTFSFSEDPGSSFVWNGSSGDVSVSGGSLSAIIGSGITRTAMFTPFSNFNGTGVVSVSNGSYNDLVSNPGAGAVVTLSVNTIPIPIPITPALSIASDRTTLRKGESALISFSFSIDPLGSFSSQDIIVSGGSLSAINGTGLIRTATFTPISDLDSGSASISVPNGSYVDPMTGTPGLGASGPAISFDTKPPTVTSFTANPNFFFRPTGLMTSVLFLQFSENIGSSLSAVDFSVNGPGSVGNVRSVGSSGRDWSADYTFFWPLSSPANFTVNLYGSGYSDLLGNTGQLANQVAVSVLA
jgi:hypothetical protein